MSGALSGAVGGAAEGIGMAAQNAGCVNHAADVARTVAAIGDGAVDSAINIGQSVYNGQKVEAGDVALSFVTGALVSYNSKSGSKTISYTDYDNIYQSSIHNAGKEKVMLGKYDGGGPTSYITKAGGDYTYFSLGDEWNTIKAKYRYTDDDMFKLFNEAFLDDGINAGKTFQFSHNPINDTGSLGQEYLYLLKNNYKWDAITMTMKPQY